MAFLAGVRVVDFSQHGPGARASRIFADYGAEVVRIGRPRHRMAGEIDTPANAYGGGRGLHRVAIDLQNDEGRALALRVAATADVVIEAFRPGVAARLGVGYEAVRALNERAIYCSLTGYGQHGPRSTWVGHDLNFEAVTGLLDRTQPRHDGGPPVLGATVADGAGGGMHAVIAVLAALLGRERTGHGCHLDVATTDGVLWLMAVQLEQHLDAGLDDGPVRLLSGDFACYRTYACRDGKWLSVGALEHRFWRALCIAIGLPQLVDDHEIDERQPALIAALDAKFRERDRDEWVHALATLDTCVAPVLTVAEVVHDPHLEQRGLLRDHHLMSLLAGSNRDEVVVSLDVLGELGLSEDEHARLAEAGVLDPVVPATGNRSVS